MLLSGTVSDPALPGASISTIWSKVSGPGTVTYDFPSRPVVRATFSQIGTYVLQLSASDSLGSNSLRVTVTAEATLAPQGWIGSPIDHSLVSGIVPVTVTGVTLQSGTLVCWPASDDTAVVTLNANTTGSGQIGALDTTTLPNGTYYLLLTATDTTGKTMGSGVALVVGGNYKAGRVTTTVTDLVVPAPGLPIRIDRTYDSLQRGVSSDFGYGWSLGINVQVEISNTNDVTLTLNGQRRTFYFTPISPGFLNFFYTPAYTAEPGFFGTLQAANNCDNLVLKSGNSYICMVGADPYMAVQLVYTDPYGRVYTIGADGSLQSVRDPSGNTLTVTPAGITSSSNGLSVSFQRDTLGRITLITLPPANPGDSPNQYQYAYDAATGNLASVTYPGVSTPSRYQYDPTDIHLYKGGTDPRNNPLPSTTYSNGRLQSVTDAMGKTTSYAYNLATNTTTITYPPDDGGNVGTAKLVYDSYGKLLSYTDPLDAADPGHHTTTNVYDAKHNLQSATDPLGHTTSYTYDVNGNQTSVTYPHTATSVNTSSYTTYNAVGEPAQTTDELGNIRNFTYDANFWPKSATDTINGSLATQVSLTFNPNGTMQAKAVGYDLTTTPGKATTATAAAIAVDPAAAASSTVALFAGVQTFPLSYQSLLARVSVRITPKVRWNAGWQFYNYHEQFGVLGYSQNFHANTGYTSAKLGVLALLCDKRRMPSMYYYLFVSSRVATNL